MPGPEPLWHLLESGPGSPSANMACDEALLEFAGASRQPALRLYGWTGPAATFGYFQRFADVAGLTNLRPLVRRPTGGGLVPHDADWTYSVALPPDNEWYELKAVDSYRRVHEWVQIAFARIGVTTVLSPCCVKAGPGQCFVGAEQFDLLFEGQKIAGAAQRRRKDGLLIQGSIQAGSTRAERRAFERAFRQVAADFWGSESVEFPVDESFRGRVRSLDEGKYGMSSYNEGR